MSKLHSAKPPSDEEVKTFVMAALKSESDFVENDQDVCSAGLFKIAKSKTESLVVSIDVNGRHFCNDLEVIHRGANGLTVQAIDEPGSDNVRDIVRDVGKNGMNVLVIPTALSDYEGANSCAAAWERIFVLQAGTMVDRSDEFRDFYRVRLNALPAEMQEIRSGKGQADLAGDNGICLQMESDKIKRFLGISPKAGEDKAIGWINSRDEFLRRKGSAVLLEIGDSKSLAVLARFAKDSDPVVAYEAKRALRGANK